MRIFSLVFVFCFLAFYDGQSQIREKEHQNTVYVTTGFLYSLSAGYERVWKATDRKRRSFRGVYGKYSEILFGDTGDIFMVGHASLIRWKRHHHLEWGVGALAQKSQAVDGSNDWNFYPAGNAGYRFMNGRGLVLRTGVGFPEALYASVGLAF